MTSFDAGRGCPFQCSLLHDHQRAGPQVALARRRTTSRSIVRANVAQGITSFFITDDNFARNKNWEPIFDRLIELREEEGFKIRLVIQVDTLCHHIPGFIEKAARAGCNAVFIGLENINPDNLLSAPRSGRTRSRNTARCCRPGASRGHHLCRLYPRLPDRYAGVDRARHRDHQEELPIDILEFFCLTPLPGSEDHKKLLGKGVRMDPDMNKYDLEHVVHRPRDHVEGGVGRGLSRRLGALLHRRAHRDDLAPRRASGINLSKIVNAAIVFSGATRIEGVHPLQFGLVRRKSRTQRRHGMPIESPLIYYPRRAAEFARNVYTGPRMCGAISRSRSA